jgi:hypothetical protein
VSVICDTCSYVSGNIDNEILDSDSDVPTTSSRKQLRSSTMVVMSDSDHTHFFHTMSRNHF